MAAGKAGAVVTVGEDVAGCVEAVAVCWPVSDDELCGSPDRDGTGAVDVPSMGFKLCKLPCGCSADAFGSAGVARFVVTAAVARVAGVAGDVDVAGVAGTAGVAGIAGVATATVDGVARVAAAAMSSNALETG
jgi:hypothetical protein